MNRLIVEEGIITYLWIQEDDEPLVPRQSRHIHLPSLLVLQLNLGQFIPLGQDLGSGGSRFGRSWCFGFLLLDFLRFSLGLFGRDFGPFRTRFGLASGLPLWWSVNNAARPRRCLELLRRTFFDCSGIESGGLEPANLADRRELGGADVLTGMVVSQVNKSECQWRYEKGREGKERGGGVSW